MEFMFPQNEKRKELMDKELRLYNTEKRLETREELQNKKENYLAQRWEMGGEFHKEMREKEVELAKLDGQIEAAKLQLETHQKHFEDIKSQDEEILKVWQKCMEHKDEEIARLNGIIEKLIAKDTQPKIIVPNLNPSKD